MMTISVKHIKNLAIALLVTAVPVQTDARPVRIGDETGNGFLFQKSGVCYVILPTHVHGRGPFPLAARDPSGIGTGRVIHRADAALDLSLGVVSGSLAADCGPDWSALPRAVDPAAGQPVTVVRYQDGSVETIRAQITTTTFTHFQIAPDADETRYFAAGTSGSFVFDGQTPLGMITEAGDRQDAYVLRMDEIHDRLRRVVEDWYEDEGCTDPAGCETPLPDPAPPTLSGFRLVEWSPQPVDSQFAADAMVAGTAPFIAQVTRSQPVTLTFEADAVREVSRVVLTSRADGATSVSPKLVDVQIDTSSDGVDRWRAFRSPRDMVPDEPLDLRRGATHARRLQIEVRSGWGDGPVRIDSVTIE